MNKITLIVGVIVLLLVIYLPVSYNGLIKANLAVDTQWAQVEAQYQRRLDLIPNLVNGVQGTLKQEKDIFTALANARSNYAGAKTVNDKVQAASQIESSLGRLLAVVENYPTLKSSDVMQTLMTQLEGTENRISVERMRFNDDVNNYNIRIKTFPGKIVAVMFGFSPRAFLQASTGADVAPKVLF